MQRDIVFVHIPKTAGSSLRVALETALSPPCRILFDYGEDPKTTPELKRLHDEKRLGAFRIRFPSTTPTFLSGHFPASRYRSFFDQRSFITFMRHPVDRMFSEYAHFKARNGFTGSLADFLELPHMTTRLQYLVDVDPSSFGFIGFTETFESSIGALSKHLGIPLSPLRRNIGDYTAIEGDFRNEANIALVRQRCRSDIAFYESIRQLHGAESAGPNNP